MHDRQPDMGAYELLQAIARCPNCRPVDYEVCDEHGADLDRYYPRCSDPDCVCCRKA